MLSIFKHQWVTRTVLLTCLNVTRSCSQAIKFMCYLILPFAVPEHWLISPLLPFLIKEHFNTVRVTDTGSNHCPWGADIFTGVDLHTAEIQFQLRPLQEEGGGGRPQALSPHQKIFSCLNFLCNNKQFLLPFNPLCQAVILLLSFFSYPLRKKKYTHFQ